MYFSSTVYVFAVVFLTWCSYWVENGQENESPHLKNVGTHLSLAKIILSVTAITKTINETCHEIFQKLLWDLNGNTGVAFRFCNRDFNIFGCLLVFKSH